MSPVRRPVTPARLMVNYLFDVLGGTGVGPLRGPGVDASGGGNDSALEPLPGRAAPGGAISVDPVLPTVEPGSVSTFDPDPAGGAPAAAAGSPAGPLV
jgi:hypothetical protein